jgi:hypothetical protein
MINKEILIVITHGVENLTEELFSNWIQLFCHCFKSDRKQALAVFEKYRIHGNKSVFCFGMIQDKAVACYSGIILGLGEKTIFLSTDTMSNGEMKSATVRLGTYIYTYLIKMGVQAVCGYPNQNIIRIRERKLGWKMIGTIYPYVGLPLLWRFLLNNDSNIPLWLINRPANGFFSKRKYCLSIFGRNGIYDNGFFTLLFAMSAKKPGVFFLRIPSFLIKPKIFGYVLLSDEFTSVEVMIKNAALNLDLNTIDVP